LGRLFFGDFDYFATLILPAVGTHAVGEFRLMAVGTLGKAGGLQGIVSAARLGALMGVSSFGIRHICTSSKLVDPAISSKILEF
jgi:hypothetical protein